MLTAAQELCWTAVPDRAIELAEKCAGTAAKVRKATKDLPTDGLINVWYNKDEDKILLNVGDWIEHGDLKQWQKALKPLANEFQCEAEIGTRSLEESPSWVKVAMRPTGARLFREKRAVSPTLSFGSKLLGYRPGILPTAPNPIVAGLASGLLGAGLGYGLGWLGETFLPRRWKRGRLRRTLAILGGVGGLSPAAIWILSNVRQGLPWYSGYTMRGTGIDDTVDTHDPYRYDPKTRQFSKNPNYSGQLSIHGSPGMEKFFIGREKQEAAEELSREKEAATSMTAFDNAGWPTLDVPEFTAAVNFDPRVRNRLDPATRAAATGLAVGASHLRGGTRFVSPLDVARLAAGMGSGYLSGLVVGKTLGVLTGLPESQQERLKNTGMWAGMIANMVPLAFS